jgi:hypothetical protein
MKYRPVISVRVILFLKVSGEDEGAPVDGNNTSRRVLTFSTAVKIYTVSIISSKDAFTIYTT